MKRTFIISALICLAISPSAISQHVKPIDKFSGIQVSGKIVLQIERKPEYTIRVDYNNIDSTCFNQQIENGVLKLELKSGYKCKGEMSISLACPELNSIVATGKSDISTANVLTGDSLKLEVRGNSRAYLDMDIKHLDANLSGGGMFNGEGYAINQSIKTTTSSIFSGFALEGEQLKVESLSNSLVKVYASENIVAKAGGGGYILYKGNPKKESLDPMSNGKIEKSEEN